MPRLFLAFPTPPETRSLLLQWQEAIPIAPGIRWLAAEDWHITALFIGNTDNTTANRIQDVLHNQTVDPPHHLSFDSMNTLYRKQKPVMWWAQYHTCPHWQRFYQSLYLLLTDIVPLEPYRHSTIPHITVARLSKAFNPLPALPPISEMPPFPLKQLWMYESVLSPSGNRYRPLYMIANYLQ